MHIAADAIDRVISVEMRRRGRERGFKAALAAVCREAEDRPLVLAAAEALDREPARITIVTGAALPDHMPVGENDGPFGAAVLAQKLEKIGHTVTICSDAECIPPIVGLLKFLGANASVLTLRKGDTAQQDEILEQSDMLIAIERLGGNPNGHLHGISGAVRDPYRTNVDYLFNQARERGKRTIAIGDGGNEIGFGKVRDALMAAIPGHNQEQRTPCGGGIFSTVATDILVFGTSSNIGAYGVLAALAMVRGDTSLCHDPDIEEQLHYVGVGLGLTDGGGGGVVPVCDGIPADCNAAIVRLIENIAIRYLDEPKVRPF
ncbi:glutamate cyclase domain-containing protein [Mesorhizobium sp. CAU 1741]|uniref:glutamate cyclase domain-containing protein n=1 Tax=Mesorhizobium sp. CAU 1741 TaxID=3140366 RepID=UPI00325AFC5D